MRKCNYKILTLTLCVMLSSQFSFATRYYVDLNSPSISVATWNPLLFPQKMTAFTNATSWATAIPDLQFAMYYAQRGDEIWVKETPFSAPYVPLCAPNRLFLENYFLIRENVRVYGGFAGWENKLENRTEWFIHQTHLSTTQHVTDYTLWMQGSNSLLDGFFIDFKCTTKSGIIMESDKPEDNQVIANTIIKGDWHKYTDIYNSFKRIGFINVGGKSTEPFSCGAVLYNVAIYGFILNTADDKDQNSLINVDGGSLDIWNVTLADNISFPFNNNPYNGIPSMAVTLGMGRVHGSNIINNPHPAFVNIVNTIIWYRDPYEYLFGQHLYPAVDLATYCPGHIMVKHSDIMFVPGNPGWNWLGNVMDAGGNIAQDPLFLIDCISPTLPSNLSHIWYEIGRSRSPAIDAGINDYPYCLPYFWFYERLDLKNEYRIVGERIDMGAFEWQRWQYDHNAYPQQAPRKNDNQDNENLLQIYPNPASQTAVLQLGKLTSGKVFITDLQGRTIETLNIAKNNLVLDVTKYQSGVYLVHIVSDKINITEKLIVGMKK